MPILAIAMSTDKDLSAFDGVEDTSRAEEAPLTAQITERITELLSSVSSQLRDPERYYPPYTLAGLRQLLDQFEYKLAAMIERNPSPMLAPYFIPSFVVLDYCGTVIGIEPRDLDEQDNEWLAQRESRRSRRRRKSAQKNEE